MWGVRPRPGAIAEDVDKRTHLYEFFYLLGVFWLRDVVVDLPTRKS